MTTSGPVERGRLTGVLVGASVALFRVLQVRYPRALRARYGAEMRSLFRLDLEACAAERGVRGLADAWLRVLGDLFRPVPCPVPVGRHRMTPGRTGGKGRRGPGWMEPIGFGWRSLRREPAFLTMVVGVLGAGVALNAAVFAVVNAYLLRPLPYPEPDRVVSIRSPVELSWEDGEGVLEKRVSWDLDAFTLTGGVGPEMALGAWVTPDFLDVYGVRPVLGRTFAPDEGVPGAATVALIGFGLWQDRYGGDPDVIGRTFRAYTSDRPEDAETFTIVGVLPRDFWHFNDYTEVLAPLRENRVLYAGRLRPDVPLERAARVLTERVRARETGLPDDFAVEVRRIQDVHVASIRPALWALQSGVFLVFLIACANAAVLLLVRSARRERELSVRRAVGASGGAIARQLVVEGLLLTALAGALGLALAWGLLEALRGVEALTFWRSLPRGAAALRLDLNVVAAALGLCALTGVAFGFVPFLATGRSNLMHVLIDTGRRSTEPIGRRRLRSVLVGVEIAFSLALLATAGLMVQSAMHLQHGDLGFDPDGVLRGQVGLRQSSYPDASERIAFFEDLAERTRGLAGADAVGMVSAAPFTWNFGARGVESGNGTHGEAVLQYADAAYFGAMRIDLVRGRLFSEADTRGAEDVVVISERLADDLWPGADPVGRRVRGAQAPMPGMAVSEPGPWATVVGVVRDVRKGVGGPEAGDLYTAVRQEAPFWVNLIVRGEAGIPSPIREIEAILAELDPDVPFSTVESLEDRVRSATAPSRFLAAVFTGFAGFALLLAVLGLYGVVSYAARQCRKDVAIRMALGANSGSVIRHLLTETVVVLMAGLVLGAVGSRLLGFALAGQLYGIEPDDPVTLVVVAALLGGTALAAAWVPVRRVGGTSPMSVLRED